MRFSTKILLSIMLLVTITLSIGGSLLIERSYKNSLNHETEAAKASYQLVVYSLAVAGKNSDSQLGTMISVLKQLDMQGDKNWERIRLTDGEQVLYSGNEYYFFDNTLDEKTSETVGATSLSVAVDGKHLLQISGQINGEATDLNLEALFDISPVYDMRNMLIKIYERMFAVVISLSLIASLAMSKWLAMPLRKLSRVSREIASGNMACRAHAEGKDEVGKLAVNFNLMADELESKMNQLEDSVARQEEFVGSFAHEMKTPMTSIIGYADMLRSRELPEYQRVEAANYIFSEGKRLESLSEKLLDIIVLKKKETTLVKCSPSAIIEGAAEVMTPVLERQGIKLECRSEEGTCLAEPALVKSVVINLVDNARKAIDGEGKIEIISSMLNDGCRIIVKDDGCGMPEEELSRITQAFYRVDKSRSRAQGGAGLGLALCCEIAEIHSGSIEFESTVGVGTSATVYLHGGRANET